VARTKFTHELASRTRIVERALHRLSIECSYAAHSSVSFALRVIASCRAESINESKMKVNIGSASDLVRGGGGLESGDAIDERLEVVHTNECQPVIMCLCHNQMRSMSAKVSFVDPTCQPLRGQCSGRPTVTPIHSMLCYVRYCCPRTCYRPAPPASTSLCAGVCVLNVVGES